MASFKLLDFTGIITRALFRHAVREIVIHAILIFIDTTILHQTKFLFAIIGVGHGSLEFAKEEKKASKILILQNRRALNNLAVWPGIYFARKFIL